MKLQNNQQRNLILSIRNGILTSNPRAFQGNTRARKEYLQQLTQIKPELTQFQKEYLVGLNLGDLTVKASARPKTARFSLQQSAYHEPWMYHVKDIFMEYMPNDESIGTISTRSEMRETQSLKCEALYEFLVPLFYPDAEEHPERESHPKRVLPGIVDYITPVSVAAWFCGDGGHTSNREFRGMTFNSQAFTAEENELLAAALRDKLGLQAEAARDTKNHNHTRINVKGPSFDSFVEQVAPYIHKTFDYRLPAGRFENSRHGYMTEALRNSLLGSSINTLDQLNDLIVNYPHRV